MARDKYTDPGQIKNVPNYGKPVKNSKPQGTRQPIVPTQRTQFLEPKSKKSN